MKKRVIRSAIPIYLCAATWFIYSMLLPLYQLRNILLCTGVSIAVFLLAGRIFPGRVVEEEEAPNSGDEEVNRQILEGRAALRSLKESAKSIDRPGVTAALERMIAAGEKIFKTVEQQPREALQVRKFMNYYLPTSVKLLEHYRSLQETGGQGENIQGAMGRIEASLEMIAAAFEKQLDRLYADDQLDITAEIRALETMMAADGLSDDLVMRGGSPENHA